MKTLLAIIWVLFSVTASAWTIVEYVPPTPAGIPATAAKTSSCVGINSDGVMACNSIYTWKKYVNRFCCTYQREFAYTVSGGVITYLPPLPGKTDTRVTVINDAGQVAGASMGAKASLLVATLWSSGVPEALAGANVTALSNTALVVDQTRVLDLATRADITPALFSYMLGVDNLGGGIGMASNPASPLEEQGLTRWPFNVDDAVYLNAYKPNWAGITDAGAVAYTYAVGYSAPYWLYDFGDVHTFTTGYASGMNQSGDVVGSLNGHAMIWGQSGVVDLYTTTGATSANAINDAGQIACQRGTAACLIF